MVTMSAIWDRTAEVLRGRGSMLAGIAALLLFLPSVAQAAAATYGRGTAGGMGLVGVIGLAAGLLGTWGNLALVAATSDPLIDRNAALTLGARRIGVAIGLSLLIGVAVVLLALPGLALLTGGLGGPFGVAALAASGGAGAMTMASPGLVFAGSLYLFVLGIAGLWLTARLSLFLPVLVNERLGLRSIARSFQLTRGLTWRIVGVAILFGILLIVALSAAQLVSALIARLLIGANGVATAKFVGAVAGAAVTAGGTVVSATFVAQLYRVVSGREAAHTFS